MSIRVEDIDLVHRVVGAQHVFTSPDVAELFVAHADEETARSRVQGVLDMIEQMKQRQQAKKAHLRKYA